MISGGHETDPRDNGRPVALIAAALGVEEQVFRDAFSGVTPSMSGPPTASHAQANKKVLMDALGKHGITNDRLDEVSNYYRYEPQSGGLWKNRPAVISASLKDGKVIGLKIEDAGAGYLAPPKVKVVGNDDLHVNVEIEFTKDMRTNGQILSAKLAQ